MTAADPGASPEPTERPEEAARIAAEMHPNKDALDAHSALDGRITLGTKMSWPSPASC
jgi:hypothetical protein